MSNKTVLLEKYRTSCEQMEPSAPLDYIQLRNQEALREWRLKLAFGSIRSATQREPGFSQRTRDLLRHTVASLHMHATGIQS